MRKLGGLVGSLNIFTFIRAIFIRVIRVVFVRLCTCLSSSAMFLVVDIFLTFEAFRRCWGIMFNLLEAIPNFHFLGNRELIKYQDICVRLDLHSTLSNCNSFDVSHCFLRAAVISFAVARASYLLLTTPFNLFNLSWGYALHLVMLNVFIWWMFSAYLRLSTSTSKLPFLVYFCFFNVSRSVSCFDHFFC